MGYQTTDQWSADRRVVARTVLWTAPWTAEYFPAVSDNRWRFLETTNIEWSKTSAIAVAEMLFELESDTGDNLAIWRRHMIAGAKTDTAVNLQAAEQMSRGDYFMSPSLNVVGNGILIPPRTRLRAHASGALVYFGAAMTVYEASDLTDIAPLIS